MVWLGIRFDTISMTVALLPDKLKEVTILVGNWYHRTTASIHDLRTLLGNIFYVAQYWPPASFFINRLLTTLRWCTMRRLMNLSGGFKKDLAWFRAFYLKSS